MTELNEEQKVEELHRSRKVHDDTTNLPETLTVIEQHQNDSNQDWKGSRTEKRGDAKLRATETGEIAIPSILQDELTNGHHENLKHPGGDRMCLTIKQHFYWKGVKDSIKSHVNNRFFL